MPHDSAQKPVIWILEDDEGMQFVYQEILGAESACKTFGMLVHLREALEQSPARPGLLVADLRLPDGLFLDLLRDDRVRLHGVPVLVVSSLDDMEVLRGCFDHGAADFMTKPFSLNEFKVKVERLLDSRGATNGLRIDPRTFTVSVDGRGTATLTGKELQIVSVLAHAPNRCATRVELAQKLWGVTDLETKALDVHLHNLRRKLRPLGLRIVLKKPNDYCLLIDGEDAEGEES